MRNLFSNSRFYILSGSFGLSGILYAALQTIINNQTLFIIRLEQVYGFLSLVFLYVALIISPFFHTFSRAPFKQQFTHARRAIGVSAFYFALLHSGIAFFGQTGGFEGISFLTNNYMLALTAGFIGLLILSILALTSFDWMIKKLTHFRWKILQRSIYAASLLILIHVLMLGSHFTTGTLISKLFFILLIFLLFLEAICVDKYLMQRWKTLPGIGMTTSVILIISSIITLQQFLPTSGFSSFNIHQQHIQLARDIQNKKPANNYIPGLDGDRNRRYSVSFETTPERILPNQDTEIHFSIYDASNGNTVKLYKVLYEKQMHCIIVSRDFTYFTHIHPTQKANSFSIKTRFPTDDIYHIYITFQPMGAIEQQFAFTVSAGNPADQRTISSDTRKEKQFEKYLVSVTSNESLSAQKMSLGEQIITFTIKEVATKKPVTTIKPYLGSFGHLTMINEKTYDFIHVHPYTMAKPKQDATTGPSVDFLPVGIYGSFKPGLYRTFAEFNIEDNIQVFDFRTKVD